MSERDRKIMMAMSDYDAAEVGTSERILAAQSLEKAAAGISERDFVRICLKYCERKIA